MDCQAFLKLHSEYLDERLEQEDADRCGAHAAACESCARYDRIVRRGLELLRREPPVSVSAEFTTRLERRLLRGRDELFTERAPGTSSGAALSLALAGLLALAAWGPMLRADGDPRTDLVLETQRGYESREPLMLPAPEWWQAPAVAPGFDTTVRPVDRMEMAFPGPYSPLIVMPPVPGRRGAAHLTALE